MVQILDVMSQLHRVEEGANQMGQNAVGILWLDCLMSAVSNNVIELQKKHEASAEVRSLVHEPCSFQGPKCLSNWSDALSNCFNPGL